MKPVKHVFEDLDTVIDRVHDMFEHWVGNGNRPPGITDDTLYRTKLAVHEWLANLVQHADFDARAPQIAIEFFQADDQLRCTIDDNSKGFDLQGQITFRKEVLDKLPDRGMGLLMLQTCTENLTYSPVGDERHRLAFAVSNDENLWLEIPFE